MAWFISSLLLSAGHAADKIRSLQDKRHKSISLDFWQQSCRGSQIRIGVVLRHLFE
jgi:hypothetical protein